MIIATAYNEDEKCKQARTYIKEDQATAANPMTFAVFGAGEINTRRLSDARQIVSSLSKSDEEGLCRYCEKPSNALPISRPISCSMLL